MAEPASNKVATIWGVTLMTFMFILWAILFTSIVPSIQRIEKMIPCSQTLSK